MPTCISSSSATHSSQSIGTHMAVHVNPGNSKSISHSDSSVNSSSRHSRPFSREEFAALKSELHLLLPGIKVFLDARTCSAALL